MGIVPVFRIIYYCLICVTSLGLKICGKRPLIGSNTALSLVDRFQLKDWALFKEVSVDFKSEPTFMVITGETGAGKSVLIGGLEYVCNGDGIRKPLFDAIGESSLVIDGGDNFKRIYSPLTRRSTCEINSKRSTAAVMSCTLDASVRFWSSENIDLLRPGQAGYYVDNLLSTKGQRDKQELGAIYRDWARTYDELLCLRDLRTRMDDGNEVELLTFYRSETSDMEESLVRVLKELQGVVEQLDDAAILGGAEGSEPGPLQRLSPQLGDVLSYKGGMSLSVAWDILEQAEGLIEGLAAALEDNVAAATLSGERGILHSFTEDMTIDSMDQDVEGQIAFSASGGGAPDRRLLTVKKQLRGLSDETTRMQADFFEMGFGASKLNEVLERVLLAVQEAQVSLDVASDALENLRRTVPTLAPVLEGLRAVRDNWETIARKHGIRPDSLGTLKEGWSRDLDALGSILVDLPRLEKEEEALRADYIALADALSKERYTAAVALQEGVAELLPQIEMGDKRVWVRVQRPCRVHLARGAALRPGLLGVSANGWDEVHLEVSTVSMDEMTPLTSVDLTKEEGEEEGDAEDDKVGVGSTADLSSGEAARLALALEASSHHHRFGKDEKISAEVAALRQRQPLVVYDEIDAHVGGEAAAAVARLLKRIGHFRQVLAITHSPVVAAAADRHLVVKKDKGTSSTRPKSSVTEVVGAAREVEIARMATGRLDTDAGETLAKSLLSLNFDG